MTNLSLSNPVVSVLIRSCNRLSHVLEALEICLGQDYDNYEIVVLDQSTEAHWENHKDAFDTLDSKVSVIRSKPLGCAGARNVGVAHCKGDVVLFLDDDDLPVGRNWISAHAIHYTDPRCIGVSGRHLNRLNEGYRYKDRKRAYNRCLSYTFFIQGRTYTGIDEVKKPVQWLHGNNCSLRRATIIKLGGWYPHVATDNEEHSLYLKLQKTLKPGEYLMFDPEPKILRRFNIAGGAKRRSISLHSLLTHRLQFYHWVLREYYPIRFYGLYPLFILYSFLSLSRFFLKRVHIKDAFWVRMFGEKLGKYLYVFQEIAVYPFLVLRFLIVKRPKWSGQLNSIPVWDGQIAIPEGEQVNEV